MSRARPQSPVRSFIIATSSPSAEIRGIVESSLGVSMDAVFSEFDEKPLGVASIGQVHKARLREGGQVVAVKVQDPKARERGWMHN